MKTDILPFLVTLFTISLSAQTTKVIKIIDANLFELGDGRIVKLAGIDAPQLSHPSAFFQSAAQDAVDYSNTNLLDRMITVETISKLPGKDFEIVMMYKNYFLNRVNLSTRFLLYGFGKFYNNIDEKLKDEFLDYQKSAIDEKRGIWLYDSLSVSDTLDSDFIQNSHSNFENLDPRLEYRVKRPIPLYQAIPLELLAGSGITFLSTLGCGLITAALFQNPWGAYIGIVYGSILTYGIGFPTGVYLVAKNANPDISYWATIGFSIGFTAATTGLSFAIFPKDRNHPTRYFALLSPIIGSILYTNFLAPTPSTKQNIVTTLNSKQNLSHKDFYNSTLLLNIDLIRINLW